MIQKLSQAIAANRANTLNAEPHHIKLQVIGQNYINLLLSTLYPLHNEKHPDNGPVFKSVNLARKTHALIKYDRIVNGQVNPHHVMGEYHS